MFKRPAPRTFPLFMAAGSLVLLASLFSGCDKKGSEPSAVVKKAPVKATMAKKSTDDVPEQAISFVQARRNLNQLLNQTLKDNTEVQALIKKRQAIQDKKQKEVFAIVSTLPGGKEIVSAINSSREEMAQLNMKQASAPPKTAEERAQYQNARKELGASMKGLWESFGALANENEQVSETREKYAPEIQSITKELNTLVRQLGHGKILRDFHQARKNQG